MLDSITGKRLIPVAVIENAGQAVPLAGALLTAGLNVIEVTLRTDAAIDAIEAIRQASPDMIVGAGTVLDDRTVPRLADLDIAFIVTPGIQPAVIESALKHNLIVIPGVMTPSEIEKARDFGLDTLKFFPAEAAGGVGMLKALAGPYGHTGIRFIPTGGVNPSNLADYVRLPAVAAVGGTWISAGNLVREGKFDEITRLGREALSIIERAGG